MRRDGVGEHGIHQTEHRRRGAERHVERHVAPGLAHLLHPAAHLLVRAVELAGIGALERVDALLGIAHREECARRALTVAAEAGEELFRENVRDAPLLGRRVLHLVEQQVVEAAVELVEHPRSAGIAQQHGRVADHVGVVEQAALALAPLVALQHGHGEV